MCGILAVFGFEGDEKKLRKKLLLASKKIRHRGPDWSGIHIQVFPTAEGKLNGFCHERLSIMDPLGGAQPLYTPDQKAVLCVNGEIFNHKELRERYGEYVYSTHSDCEPILPAFLHEDPASFLKELRGQFSFIVSDAGQERFLAARDAIGVCPLYYGNDPKGAIWFSSEMKALEGVCISYKCFPPGHYYLFDAKKMSSSEDVEVKPIRYFEPEWYSESYLPASLGPDPLKAMDYAALRGALEEAVRVRLMCDVPYGVLLSGGLDSSLIASITSRFAAQKARDDPEGVFFPRLHSFSIGLEGSPDLKAARSVAAFLKTSHHEMTFTLQEGMDAVQDVIYHLETYDVTTIRAATPMYLMSRKIKSMGIKMVLSGEGADEIFAGYLYFHKAPNKEELQAELYRKLHALHLYDCNRADKSTMAWGLETRVPFLDTNFLNVAMNVDPGAKMIHPPEIMEKYVLRKAFDTPDDPYLPDSVLWRQKEQFSDGVGYGWIDSLRDRANIQVSDLMFAQRSHRFPYNTPPTKEGYMFRTIFEDLFKNPCAAVTVPGGPSIACSTPTAMRWAKEWESMADPSGRAMAEVHCSTAKN